MPFVLVLFTRAPLGIGWSLVLGVALMLSHRVYARPFALRRAGRRCLWCARAAPEGPLVEVAEPLGTTRWRACTEAHAGGVRRLLSWADAHRRLLRIGILGTPAAFLLAAALMAVRVLDARHYSDAVNLFRLGIAASVLPLGLLGTRGPRPGDATARSPFPLHIQALVGTWTVVWLFRIVGFAWLVLGAAHFVGRP